MNVHFDEKAPRDTQVLVDTQAIRENFRNIKEMCGETTAESFIHLQGGKKLCRDCYKAYRRFDI